MARRGLLMLSFVAVLVAVAGVGSARAQNPYTGEIRMFAGNYAPAGWALCEGQLLPISQYVDLFLVIGTTYGGDGQQNFALPDLRGRVPIHAADGPGLPPRVLGETGGAAGSTPLNVVGLTRAYAPGEVTTLAGPNARAVAAGGAVDDRMPPFLGINFIIALQGIFPPH